MNITTNLPILDNVIFTEKLSNYFNNKEITPKVNPVLQPHVNIIDDYRNDQKLFKLHDIRFKFRSSGTFVISSIGLDTNNKIINITNKIQSYFSIVDYLLEMDLGNIVQSCNELVSTNNYTIIEEEVFLFFDCFPFAPVHNLDDTYNLLYFYKKSNLTCKLAVIKTDNYFYNQTLLSLQKYFNLIYIYLDFDTNYLFGNLYCTRQYHWLQKEAKEFINKEYINKIIKEYEGKEYYDNICILKYQDPKNVSSLDTFSKSELFNTFCKDYNIVDLNNYANNLEYKIYLINKAKKIITNYLSPFNVNIYKHCSDFTNKEIFILNGGVKQQETNINKHFEKIDTDIYNFYGTVMKVYIIDNIANLDNAPQLLSNYF
jgi:hypothetical protein